MQIIPFFLPLAYKPLMQSWVGGARGGGLFQSAAEHWEHAEDQHQVTQRAHMSFSGSLYTSEFKQLAWFLKRLLEKMQWNQNNLIIWAETLPEI